MNPMSPRILYLAGNGFPRSTTDPRGMFSFEHVRALQSLGAKVMSVDLQADDFGHDMVADVEIRRIPRLRPILRKGNFGRLRQYLAARRALKTLDYDVVAFSFGYLKYLPLLFSLRKPGVTVLMIVMGGEVMPGGMVRRWLKKWFFSMGDVITPISEYTETLLSCLIGRRDTDNARIVTIPCGIEVSKLKTANDPARLRDRLRIPQEAFVALSVGNLVKRKGVDDVARAVAQLQADGHNAHHVMIGRGVEKGRLEALAEAAPSSANFHFIDSVDSAELADFYAMADVFALLSKTSWDAQATEGFGIVYAEAMALGTPVIGGSGSGASEPVKHGFNGILINPHAPDADAQIAAAMTRFIVDDDFRERISANGASYVHEYLTWEGNAKETLKAIARVKSPHDD